jgi:type III pantothenate kinase
VLVALDVGNSETVVGLFDGVELVDHWRVASHAERTSDELALLFQQLLAFGGYNLETDVTGLVVSSTVPRMTAAIREVSDRYLGFHAVILEAGIRTGMPIRYDNPREVGPDRIANAVGALEQHGPPLVIVDFSGTATILDAVSDKGEYLGGVLVPGIEIGLDALIGRAAMLRGVEIIEPRSVIGRSSQESIQSGVVHGMGSLVDGVVGRIEDELEGDVTVVATGSLADLMLPFCSRVEHVDPWLTLRGLRSIYEKNAS